LNVGYEFLHRRRHHRLPAQPTGCRSLIIVFVIVVILMAAFIAIIAKIFRDLGQQ
jgi:hypothetical protein